MFWLIIIIIIANVYFVKNTYVTTECQQSWKPKIIELGSLS